MNLKQYHLELLVIGQLLSRFGENISYIVLINLVYVETSNLGNVSILMIVMATPVIFIGPFAGVVIDRTNKKYILLLCDLVRAALLVALVFDLSQIMIYLVVFVLSLLNTIFNSTLQASIPLIVEKDKLLKANSGLQTAESFAVIFGPVVGGILTSSFGEDLAFLVDSLTYIISFALIVVLSFQVEAKQEKENSWIKEFRSGLALITQNSIIRFLILSYALFSFSIAFVNVTAIGYAHEVLNAGIKGYGFIESAWGGGMVLGGLSLTTVLKRANLGIMYISSLLITGMAIVLITGLPRLIPVLFFFFIIGVGNIVISILSATALQQIVPDQLRGKVFTVRVALLQFSSLVSMGLAGLLSKLLAINTILAAAGFILITGSVLSMTVPGLNQLKQFKLNEQA